MAQLKETTINGTLTTSGNILPGTDGTHDLGSSSANWRTVYATSFVGTLTGNATSADKLNNDAGSSTNPVYFSNGIPVPCVSDPTDRRTFAKLTGNDLKLGLIGVNKKTGTDRTMAPLFVDEQGLGYVNLHVASETLPNGSGGPGIVGVDYETNDDDRKYAVKVDNSNLYVEVPWKNTWQKNAVTTDGYVPAPTSANANKLWMTDNTGEPDWRSAPMNSLGTAGYVSAPASSTKNKVWKTNENGEPGWRDDADSHCTVTNNNATLAWDTSVTIANVGGTDINVKLPANPDTDTNTTYTLDEGDSQGQIKLTPSAGNAMTITAKNLGTSGTPTFSSVTASNFYANSDRRLKKDIRPYSADYSSIIDSIPVYLFSYLSDKEGKTVIGTVAQELRDILPEELREAFISGEETENTYLSISEQKLIYLLIGAFKEEKAKREALEAEVADLKAKVDKLLGE